jgi:hypothetical protein
LYLGLFVSPYVLLFAASVFFLNHGKVIPVGDPAQTCLGVNVPAGILDAQGPAAIPLVRHVLDHCGVRGEIGFVRTQRKEQRVTAPVTRPGFETTITIDVAGGSASISGRRMGVWETIGYLHKTPGPHNAAIRGNWFGTRAWRWVADGTVYLLLFISASGVYLWLAIRAERRVGIALLTAGALSFFGSIYAILR